MIRNADRRRATTYSRELAVIVDREKARFSAWYEMFPRSSSPQPGRHGTLQDCTQEVGLRGRQWASTFSTFLRFTPSAA